MKRVWIKALDYAIKTCTGRHDEKRDVVPDVHRRTGGMRSKLPEGCGVSRYDQRDPGLGDSPGGCHHADAADGDQT